MAYRRAFPGAQRAARASVATSGSDAIIQAGNSYFLDNFSQSVTRAESFASKLSKFQAKGWLNLKDNTDNPLAAGDIYTLNQAGGLSEYAYSGYWPSDLTRCMIMDGNPNDGSFTPGIGRQTDFYVQLDEIVRPETVFEYGIIIFGQLSGGGTPTRSKDDKWLYFAHHGVDQGFDLVTDGSSACEASNPAWSGGERDTFDNAMAPAERTYNGMRAAGIAGEAVLTNTNVGGGPGRGDVLPQNVNQTYLPFDQFEWHRWYRKISGAQATYTHRARRPNGAWVTRSHYVGGVTSGFDHPIPVGFRTVDTGLKVGTTWNQRTPIDATTGGGHHVKAIFQFGAYPTEADCPVRADE